MVFFFVPKKLKGFFNLCISRRILFRAQKTERLFQFMHKSAPYLRRVKNSKKTSKCQVFFYSTRKPQKLDRIGTPIPASACPRRGRRGTVWDFPISIVSKHQKIEEGPFGEFFAEKNLKGGPLVSSGTVCYAEKQEKRPGLI